MATGNTYIYLNDMLLITTAIIICFGCVCILILTVILIYVTSKANKRRESKEIATKPVRPLTNRKNTAVSEFKFDQGNESTDTNNRAQESIATPNEPTSHCELSITRTTNQHLRNQLTLMPINSNSHNQRPRPLPYQPSYDRYPNTYELNDEEATDHTYNSIANRTISRHGASPSSASEMKREVLDHEMTDNERFVHVQRIMKKAGSLPMPHIYVDRKEASKSHVYGQISALSPVSQQSNNSVSIQHHSPIANDMRKLKNKRKNKRNRKKNKQYQNMSMDMARDKGYRAGPGIYVHVCII